VNRFDVSVYAIRRRTGRRRPFEVRWRAAGRSRSKSFITRKLADSYRAELVRAARMGLDFDPLTGEPTAWDLPEPAIVTWYEEATAEALATVTPVLTRPDARNRPDPRQLRTALYQHAFNDRLHPLRPRPRRPPQPADRPRARATGKAVRARPWKASGPPTARLRRSQRLHRPREGH
jgi:hypothetical protein